MRFLIIDWKEKIKAFQDAVINKDILIKNIKKDLKSMQSALSNEEEVILIFARGSRYEIYPEYEKDFDYVHSLKKGNFKKIFEMKALEREIIETENTLRGLLKNNPAMLAEFEETLEIRHTLLLFTIYFYKNNKINKSYKKLTYKNIEAYVYKFLNGFGIAI